MRSRKMREFWRSVAWCGAGVLGVALLTLLGFRLHLSLTAVSSCYLLLLVLQSMSGDFPSALATAFLSVACLNYFFVQPLFSFHVANPLDVLALIAFLATGLTITRLVTKVRAKTETSRLQHENLQRLYGLAQQLLSLEPARRGENNFLEPFRGVFGITSVCLFDAVSADVYIAGKPRSDLEERTGKAFVHGSDSDDRERGVTVRCMRAGSKTIGAIGFEGLADPARTAGPLAALAAAHLDRTHSLLSASRAAADAQTESYRSAILDALAHEFKTPLSTILAAAGALREARSLGPDHNEMAETVETEVARLDRLTSRLIRTARLEREEVKPWMELIDLSEVIAETVEQYAKLSTDRRICIVKECDSSEVMADPELLRLAVSQLLDNACKYSLPGSTVALTIAREHSYITLRIVSRGTSIPSLERSKIFDRFYRGIDARRRTPGSGLGLFVARKIALALGGGLDLDNESDPSGGTAFRLALPVPEGERDDIAQAV
jgi:two-component system sensor histidine kinase KdpD